MTIEQGKAEQFMKNKVMMPCANLSDVLRELPKEYEVVELGTQRQAWAKERRIFYGFLPYWRLVGTVDKTLECRVDPFEAQPCE